MGKRELWERGELWPWSSTTTFRVWYRSIPQGAMNYTHCCVAFFMMQISQKLNQKQVSLCRFQYSQVLSYEDRCNQFQYLWT